MRVECIRGFRDRGLGEISPVVGQTYTVREVTWYTMRGYRFMEITNVPQTYMEGYYETSFDCRHFRPITDISALTKLTKIRELEDA